MFTASLAAAENAPSSRPAPNATGIHRRDFRHNLDGAWSPVRKVTVVGPRGLFTVAPRQAFWLQLQGATNYGVNIAQILDSQCL